jgi:hypothetical protein
MFKRKWIGAFIFFFCFLCFITRVEAGKRTALVIGNADYRIAPLKNPVNDARDMAKALRHLNFDVIERINASQREMILAVDLFYKRLKRAELGVFYFAGHGMQIDGVNYLIPVNARVTTETDLEFEAVAAGRILGKMQSAGNRLNIVILDACRDNPFKRSFRTSQRGLAQMDAPKGTIIAYATSPGSVAADGSGRNGVYTKYLLKKLQVSGMSVYEVFQETGLAVMRETAEKQIPWISSTPVPRYYMAGTSTGRDDTQRNRFLEKQARLESQRLKLEQEKLEFERKKRDSEKHETKIASISHKPDHVQPSLGDKIGTIRSLNRSWRFFIIDILDVGAVKMGDQVFAVGRLGKQYALHIGRVSGNTASATCESLPNENLERLSVYKGTR